MRALIAVHSAAISSADLLADLISWTVRPSVIELRKSVLVRTITGSPSTAATVPCWLNSVSA